MINEVNKPAINSHINQKCIIIAPQTKPKEHESS